MSLSIPEASGRGRLLAIGGAEDKQGPRRLLRYFVELCGGDDARIAIIPTASEVAETGERYRRQFATLGAESTVLDIQSRAEAADPQNIHRLFEATGIFLTGGNQLKLTTLLGGTPLQRAIHSANSAGAVVAGTSAGASALSLHMIESGRPGEVPRYGSVRFAPGLGLLGEAIIDQHFGERRRLGRLLTAVAFNPALIGVGVDEDTAAVIDAEGRLEVIGRGAVVIVDGSGISYSDLHRLQNGQAATIDGIRQHVLYAGQGYDLETREPAGECSAADSNAPDSSLVELPA